MDRDTMTNFRVSEMMGPSLTPKPVRSAGAGFGLGDLGAPSPQFLDAGGAPISTVESGQPYGFNVPGYSNIWLILTKDGAQVYNASFALPMALHTAQDSEIGTWVAMAYDPVNGSAIGSTTLVITAAGTGTGTSTGLMAWINGLTPTQKALGAGAILFLMTRKKGAK